MKLAHLQILRFELVANAGMPTSITINRPRKEGLTKITPRTKYDNIPLENLNNERVFALIFWRNVVRAIQFSS